MANTQSNDDTWSFTDFVEFQSQVYPELRELLRLLTGRYPPNSACLTWTQSQKVNVIVVDIIRQPPSSKVVYIEDMVTLQQFATVDISDDVVLRLFLVEDMTAPVIEVLGAVYHCHPHLFENHMLSVGERVERVIDNNGQPSETTGGLWFHSRVGEVTGEAAQNPYFSLPFFRSAPYDEFDGSRPSENRSSLPRKSTYDSRSLEERVSGAIYDLPHRSPRVGIFLFDSMIDPNPDDCWSIINNPVFHDLPRFANSRLKPTARPKINRSLRTGLAEQLKTEIFVNALLEDESILLWALLKSILPLWWENIGWFRSRTSMTTNDESIRDNIHLFDEIIRRSQEAQENLDFLDQSLAVIQAGGVSNLLAKPNTKTYGTMIALRNDYQNLHIAMRDLVNSVKQGASILAAKRSILESEKAIQQSNRLGVLTTLASFYIPLSFAASIFGMNVTAISATDTPLWMYFAVAIPLTVFSLIAVLVWQNFGSILAESVRQMWYSYTLYRIRGQLGHLKRNTIQRISGRKRDRKDSISIERGSSYD